MLNDKCENNEWCKVVGGWCDLKINSCACKDGYVPIHVLTCAPAKKLGEICEADLQCYYKDSDSHCALSYDKIHIIISKCICKKNFHIEIINGTEKCISSTDSSQDIKEGLAAAPIILFFMACVIIEALCLLAFRCWKKHHQINSRAAEQPASSFEIHQLNITTVPSPTSPFGSIVISLPDVQTLGSESSSPPPYNSTINLSNVETTENEEPPPTYEEAIKYKNRIKNSV
ncbi:uncharacterized protein [Centruroides vittatus]|uniref:uncharacterized protein isoform X1 n=1 Tax=Centruroides vittatus TaxID=120091 RepID=UPI00350FA709